MGKKRAARRHRGITLGAQQSSKEVPHIESGGQYNIVEVEKKTPVHTSPLSIFTLLLGFVNLCLYLSFLVWNLSEARKEGSKFLWSAHLFAFGQILDNASPFTETLWRMLVACIRNPIPRPTLRILGDKVPTVDVIVVSCGELTDIVLDTVKAACLIDYPVDRVRVILADDMNDPDLKKQVVALRKKHRNLHYSARSKVLGAHHGYKAGNINTTMRTFVRNLPGGQSEFLAIFDADMMPEPGVLRALVPHALRDEKVGMVTVAQHFYNIPDNDPLYQSNITGTGCDDGIRDSVGAAWCPGCGFVMRTEAWENIGGFPEFTITEDLITSWFLHGKGWKIVLVHEVMQWGLQPDCMVGHLKQRRRWWTGHILDSFKFGLTLTEPRLAGATLVQRIAMFHHSIRPYMGTVFKFANLACIAVCLWIGDPVVAMPFAYSLPMMVSFAMTSRLLARFGELRSSVSMYNAYRRQATNTWMGLHFSRDVALTVLPKWLGGMRLGFQVTGVDEPNKVIIKERGEHNAEPLHIRLKYIHQREGILWYLSIFSVMAGFVLRQVWLQVRAATIGGVFVADEAFWIRFISSVGFPGLGVIETVPLYLTPIVYMIFPPLMPSRRESMKFDRKTGAWRPHPRYKTIKWTWANLWLCIPHWIATFWVVYAFVIAVCVSKMY